MDECRAHGQSAGGEGEVNEVQEFVTAAATSPWVWLLLLLVWRLSERWLPTSREMKYKAQQAVAFYVRAGDVVSGERELASLAAEVRAP